MLYNALSHRYSLCVHAGHTQCLCNRGCRPTRPQRYIVCAGPRFREKKVGILSQQVEDHLRHAHATDICIAARHVAPTINDQQAVQPPISHNRSSGCGGSRSGVRRSHSQYASFFLLAGEVGPLGVWWNCGHPHNGECIEPVLLPYRCGGPLLWTGSRARRPVALHCCTKCLT